MVYPITPKNYFSRLKALRKTGQSGFLGHQQQLTK